MGERARQRVLKAHTSERRADELERLLFGEGARVAPARHAGDVQMSEA
jgi:hypothetical protein